MKSIRVLIVDDQQLVREGIASLLALQEGIEIAGTAANGRDGLAVATETSPDVILMDIRMPVMDGIAAATELSSRGSTARILMLTTFDDEEYIVKSLRAGAVGYLMKDLPIEDLARAIQQVHNGTFQLAAGVVGSLLERISDPGVDETAPNPELERLYRGLSDREREILSFLGRGATNREIAESLYLSEGTVKNYVSDLLTALDARDRTQAALMAVRYGWDRSEPPAR